MARSDINVSRELRNILCIKVNGIYILVLEEIQYTIKRTVLQNKPDQLHKELIEELACKKDMYRKWEGKLAKLNTSMEVLSTGESPEGKAHHVLWVREGGLEVLFGAEEKTRKW